MTAATACRTCGSLPRTGARFCDGCGAPVTEEGTRAEYKQVTVLFADVVHSMDIAAAVGPERLREIMTDLVDRCSAVVKRYGGTVDKFTGDGIMAVFGAPAALEDHAIRASLAALGVQEEEARVETGGPSLTQGRSESSAQPLPDERLRAGRIRRSRRLELIHLACKAGVLEEYVTLRVVATRRAGIRRRCCKHPVYGRHDNRGRLGPPVRSRRPRWRRYRRAEHNLLLGDQNRRTRHRLEGGLDVRCANIGFWCCGHFSPPCGSNRLLMSCRRCTSDGRRCRTRNVRRWDFLLGLTRV